MNKALLTAIAVTLTIATVQAKVYCWTEFSEQVCGTEAEYNAHKTANSLSAKVFGVWGVIFKKRSPEERAEMDRLLLEEKRIRKIYAKVAKKRQEYLEKKAARLGLMSDSPEDIAETKRIMAAIKKKYPIQKGQIDLDIAAYQRKQGEAIVGTLKTFQELVGVLSISERQEAAKQKDYQAAVKKAFEAIDRELESDSYKTDAYEVQVKNGMRIYSIEDTDMVPVEIIGKGDTCKLDYGSTGEIFEGNCKTFTNSKGVKIYCSSKKEVCKTYAEIKAAIFE